MDKILAIAKLRFKLFARSARGVSGTVNLLSTIVMAFFGILLSLAMAVGFGALVYVTAGTDEPTARISYLIVFYTFFFFGIILPVMRGAMDVGFDAAPFRIFPVTRRWLYAIMLAASFANPEHLLYYPAAAAVCVAASLLLGASAAPGLALFALALLFLVAWGNTLTLVVVTVMRKRRIKELLAILAFALLVSVSVVPSLTVRIAEDDESSLATKAAPVLRAMGRASSVLPPSIAASGLAALHAGRRAPAVGAMLGLLLWDVAGVSLGYFVFSRFHLGDRGARVRPRARASGAESETRTSRRMPTSDIEAFSFVPVEIRAVTSKDLRYLFRSVVGKFNLVMMPVLVLIVAFIFLRDVTSPFLGMDPERLVLYGLLLYTVLFSNNFVNNAFAWESGGIRCYFMSPASTTKILAGKNLAVWLYSLVLFAICIVTWSAVKGIPDPNTLVVGLLLYCTCLLTFTCAGNFVSVLFPVSRNISSIRNTPSQAGILLSLASLVVAASFTSLFLVAPILLGAEYLQPVSLIVLLAIQAWIYSVTLKLAARLFERRKSKVIEALEATR